LYGIDASEQNLITINNETGAQLSTLPMDAVTPIIAIAIDPKTAQMYAGGGGGIPFVYMVNHTTGLAIFIGDSGLGFATIPGMDFRSDGTLFASVNLAKVSTKTGDNLATVDTTTGVATVIGPYGKNENIENLEGIAFDPDGVLFGAHTTPGGGGPGGLYTIDITSGKAVIIDRFTNSTTDGDRPSNGIGGIQFIGKTLYGGTGALPGNDDGGSLVTIDTATGIFTNVGHTTDRDGRLVSFAFTTTSFVDLSITTTVDKSAVTFGELVTFSVTIDNVGPDNATNIVVRDVVPSGFTLAEAPTLGSYDDSSGDWTISRLDADSSATLTITGTPVVSGNIENTAEVISMDQKHKDQDSIPGNDDPSEDDQDSAIVAANLKEGSFEASIVPTTGTITLRSSVDLIALAGDKDTD